MILICTDMHGNTATEHEVTRGGGGGLGRLLQPWQYQLPASEMQPLSVPLL